MNRFHGHAAVARVRGKSLRLTCFSVRYSYTNKPDYRMAVVVSKKVAKSAVVRNRIRRRIFEQFRMDGRAAGHGVDMIVYVSDVSLATMPADRIAACAKQALDTILASANRRA